MTSGGFPAAAKTALADAQLRRNMGKATTAIRVKRARAVAELDDWEALRDAGAAIKEHAMATLPEQLERLEERVTAAGGTVHWARDGAEANGIVARIAREHGSDEVIKVKSLASDEIKLNEALALRGIAAIETDLAELIVQLGDDEQSHILVPAIHRNRAEIAALFERTIAQGQQLGLEPAAIAEAARRHLREKFLSVPVAVSGANFAIAETGAVGVVESEGNGRMCTTLPDVLITLMGIEKVLPEWRDLEVMLQVLPRSSTAERMNPYTSIWTGVREGDGPREFHLVLLDAGRTDVLADARRPARRCAASSSTRWNSRGPSPSRTPVQMDVYGFIRSAVEERGSTWSITSRSRHSGSTFSMPISVIRTSGSVVHMRPLPSDSTTPTAPVSAIAKFAPLTATGTDRNFSRRCRRAASAIAAGSSPSCWPWAIVRSKSAAISARLRWIAGTRMWDCSSSPSCTISSARSVSMAAMPRSASASLSLISSDASDLTLITSSLPCSRAMRATIPLASAPSRAQWTVPPAAVTRSSRRSSCSGSVAMACSLIAAPASRSASQSSSSATALARLTRIAVVALPMLRRSWASASAVFAAAGNPPEVIPAPPGSPRSA
jgi:L-lactate utilization protein LutC